MITNRPKCRDCKKAIFRLADRVRVNQPSKLYKYEFIHKVCPHMKHENILKGRAKLLDSWGGRTEQDVMRDEVGEYVLMASGYGNDVKVYLTNENKGI